MQKRIAASALSLAISITLLSGIAATAAPIQKTQTSVTAISSSTKAPSSVSLVGDYIYGKTKKTNVSIAKSRTPVHFTVNSKNGLFLAEATTQIYNSQTGKWTPYGGIKRVYKTGQKYVLEYRLPNIERAEQVKIRAHIPASGINKEFYSKVSTLNFVKENPVISFDFPTKKFYTNKENLILAKTSSAVTILKVEEYDKNLKRWKTVSQANNHKNKNNVRWFNIKVKSKKSGSVTYRFVVEESKYANKTVSKSFSVNYIK